VLSDEEYEQLAAALREKLQSIFSHIDPTVVFQARLECELAAEAAEIAARRKGYRALSASIPVLAVATAAALVLAASSSPPAFAVTRKPDGTVAVTLREITAVGGANAKLHALGVSDVVVVPVMAGCKTQIALSYIATDSPAGGTVGSAAAQTQGQIVEALGKVSGPAPTCVASIPASAEGAPTGPLPAQTSAPAATTGSP
jgi:hypothetical protein